MILYYAIGGGLGHIVRAAKLKAFFKLGKEFMVFTASPTARKIFADAEIATVPISYQKDPQKLNQLVLSFITECRVTELWVDTFPFGILGELDLAAISTMVKIRYVARYVKWPAYQSKVKDLPALHEALVVDRLHPDQQEFIDKSCACQSFVDLSQVRLNRKAQTLKKYSGTWLIMHSGSDAELTTLKSYADDVAEAQGITPKFVVASQCQPDFEVEWHETDVPANIDLDSVDRIFTACGYNSMQELLPYKHKHCYIPFDRKYDDQYLRAKRDSEKLR